MFPLFSSTVLAPVPRLNDIFCTLIALPYYISVSTAAPLISSSTSFILSMSFYPPVMRGRAPCYTHIINRWIGIFMVNFSQKYVNFFLLADGLLRKFHLDHPDHLVTRLKQQHRLLFLFPQLDGYPVRFGFGAEGGIIPHGQMPVSVHFR